MKFFRELASCCRPSTSALPSRQESDEVLHVVASLPSSRRHAKRVNKSGGGRGGSASSATRHWRPVLQVIREDGVVFCSEARNTIAGGKRTHGENKSKGRYMSKPHRVSRNENSFYSRNDNVSEPIYLSMIFV
ncbi:hypothetical protein V6N13_101167 [Hibiscus sabdariffa]|uniref:Uncharacterized protein n=1 Tax=Hibiscus sabdariffa TaxID=183260 RepID=A0ABR2QKY1_9ROSI